MPTLVPTQGCLFTTFKNVSGGTMTFSFLPPHGRELADDGELTVFGDPIMSVTRSNYRASKRNYDALALAIADGDLDIVSTPCVVVYDETDLASYTIQSDNATLTAVEPDWGSSSA